MEFRLIYKGPLPSQRGGGHGGSVVRQKHAIRRQLHSQLRDLWQQHHLLSRYMKHNPGIDHRSGKPTTCPVDFIANDNAKFGYRFVPLVRNDWGIACALDILFLRRDDPGNLIVDGGDIDNRIKVLFDGLRVPEYNHEIEGIPPEADEDPFFCLLEDDRLITEVKVTTDRLLLPIERDEQIEDVHLILHVKTKILDSTKAFSTFGH